MTNNSRLFLQPQLNADENQDIAFASDVSAFICVYLWLDII